MRLRRSHVRGPGIRRVRRGAGFSYHQPDGSAVTDPATLQRIEDLVIPPAWKDVWICPFANGHIQAVGTDAAGRRQYLYHEKWQQERNEEKFDRVLEMSAALPDMRQRIGSDLRGRGLTRDRVIALALHLLDLGYFRAGSEQYAEENNSFGIATLMCEHVTLRRDAVEFDYPAKSGIRRTLQIDDPEVVRSVRALLRRPDRTERLLVCRNASPTRINSVRWARQPAVFAQFRRGIPAVMQDSDELPDDVPVADAVEQQRDTREPVLDEEASAEPPDDPPLEAAPSDWQEQLETVELDPEEDEPTDA